MKAARPQEIGGYRILATLGRGGMGAVYRARDAEGRTVALKVLHAHLDDPEARERLTREVAALQRVRHKGVARVLDAEIESTEAFVVTELVSGRDLGKHVRQKGALPVAELATLAGRLRAALAVVHRAKVLHRDLTPGNVMITPDGPVLIDFGLAQAVEDARVTSVGLVTGTPGYVAPELLEGEQPSVSSDWWGWAAVVTFAATGRPPFGRGAIGAVLTRVRAGEPDLTGLSPRLAEVLRGGLAVEPRERTAPAKLVAALQELADEAAAEAAEAAALEAAEEGEASEEPEPAEAGAGDDGESPGNAGEALAAAAAGTALAVVGDAEAADEQGEGEGPEDREGPEETEDAADAEDLEGAAGAGDAEDIEDLEETEDAEDAEDADGVVHVSYDDEDDEDDDDGAGDATQDDARTAVVGTAPADGETETDDTEAADETGDDADDTDETDDDADLDPGADDDTATRVLGARDGGTAVLPAAARTAVLPADRPTGPEVEGEADVEADAEADAEWSEDEWSEDEAPGDEWSEEEWSEEEWGADEWSGEEPGPWAEDEWAEDEWAGVPTGPPRRAGTVAALALPFVALGVARPGLALAIAVVLAVLVRSVGLDAEALQRRRARHGERPSDTAAAVLSWPWYLVRALIGVVPAVLVGGAVVVIVGGVLWWLTGAGHLVVAAPELGQSSGALDGNAQWVGHAALALMVVLGLLMLWFGPLSRATRSGARWVLASAAPGPVGALAAVGVGLVLGAVLLGVMLGQDVAWWPLGRQPDLG